MARPRRSRPRIDPAAALIRRLALALQGFGDVGRDRLDLALAQEGGALRRHLGLYRKETRDGTPTPQQTTH
jgi:hypothetical protein